MDWIQALILGLIQGLTEYLPVSSSGHLTIGQEILGVSSGDNLACSAHWWSSGAKSCGC